MTRRCRLCAASRLVQGLDFGTQPLCNRFLTSPSEHEYTHALALGRCESCGLVQIAEAIAPDEIRSRFSWLSYTEPEEHLDALADAIAALPGVSPTSTGVGLSSVDDSLLARLAQRGLSRLRRLDLRSDLGAADDVVAPGVETIQQRLTPAAAGRLRERHGAAGLVVGRYILEHAHDLRAFLEAAGELLLPGGYLVIEVPDCRTAFDALDYSAVWEEHIAYFTEAMLRRALEYAGYAVVRLESEPYPLQNALVAVAIRSRETGAPCPGSDTERLQWEAWVGGFEAKRGEVRQFLSSARSLGRPVVMLGAAQRGCSFINLLDVGDLLDFVADDHPHKQGLFMPGSRLPIRPTSELSLRDCALCLVSARPEIIPGLGPAHAAFVAQGGEFVSIYPAFELRKD